MAKTKFYICPGCMKDNYRYLRGTDCLLRQGTDKPTCCMLNVVVKQLELRYKIDGEPSEDRSVSKVFFTHEGVQNNVEGELLAYAVLAVPKEAYQMAVKAGELRLMTEARLGELIKQEQQAGRLATQGRPNKPSNVGRLKDYGLTWKD